MSIPTFAAVVDRQTWPVAGHELRAPEAEHPVEVSLLEVFVGPAGAASKPC